MFGIVRPCRHVMCKGLYADWMAHLCGLCLALRDEHGQLSRLVTNYDGLLVSVLTEAQAVTPPARRRAGPCPLRGFARADVAQADGARLAASVSLLLAAGKMRDHVSDGDGRYARPLVAAAATRLARRWSASGTTTADALGFDPRPLTSAAARQALLERPPHLPPTTPTPTVSASVPDLWVRGGTLPGARADRGSVPGSAGVSAGVAGSAPDRWGRGDGEGTAGGGLRELTGPTEEAVAAAFGYTAVLADRPGNREALEAAGRAFGRLAHLLDAVEDLADDRASGAYNPLDATGTTLADARRHCDAARTALREAVDDLDLPRPGLTRALLVKETGRAVSRAFATAGARPPVDDPGAPPGRRRQDPGGLLSFMCTSLTCCTCGLYRPEWDEEHESSFCQRCDCSDWDCCSNCNCGCCCSEDGGCSCDGCSCGCD
ncbi:DUF5685 family protein [Nonomuraea sp. SBT364]|uniref:DUF5685 family protein n=1 Tax=Nonomuraea sp. SBT364 TaxID=1580530 RepID=UPI00066E3015|nr:DUF5685 family protein [Nonomuraea sp. SBT364]